MNDVSSEGAICWALWGRGGGGGIGLEYSGIVALLAPTFVALSLHPLRLQSPEHASEEGSDFLKQCFQKDPHSRPDTQALLRHAFLKAGVKFVEFDDPDPQLSWCSSGDHETQTEVLCRVQFNS